MKLRSFAITIICLLSKYQLQVLHNVLYRVGEDGILHTQLEIVERFLRQLTVAHLVLIFTRPKFMSRFKRLLPRMRKDIKNGVKLAVCASKHVGQPQNHCLLTIPIAGPSDCYWSGMTTRPIGSTQFKHPLRRYVMPLAMFSLCSVVTTTA